MIDYLIKNKQFLSIRAINGSQNLPKKYEKRLSEFIMGLQNPKSVGKDLK